MKQDRRIWDAGYSSICVYTWDDDKLSWSTPGCGCCGDGGSTTDVNKAIEFLEDHIKDLEQQIAGAKAYVDLIKKEGKIVL